MDIYAAYSSMNKSLLGVVKALNILEPVKEEVKVDVLRVVESPFLLTQAVVAAGKVVTAHNLYQYRNDFHKLTLEEDITVMLDELLEIDEQREVLC